MKKQFTLLLLSAWIIACGVDTTSSGITDYDAGIQSTDMMTNLDMSALGSDMFETTNSLEGTWAQRVILSGIADVPVLGFQETNTVGLGLVELSKTGDLIEYRLKICETKIQRSDDIVTTLIPEQFIESIPYYYRTGFVDESTIHFSKMAEINGVRLQDPMMEMLPTEIDDPRIFDQDRDGFPGVTVYVTGLISGQIYLIQRTITQLSGTIEDRKISGLVTWKNDETILDSDQDLLKMGAPITPNIDATRSVFDLIQISTDSTCADVIDMAPMIFDPGPLEFEQ